MCGRMVIGYIVAGNNPSAESPSVKSPMAGSKRTMKKMSKKSKRRKKKSLVAEIRNEMKLEHTALTEEKRERKRLREPPTGAGAALHCLFNLVFYSRS